MELLSNILDAMESYGEPEEPQWPPWMRCKFCWNYTVQLIAYNAQFFGSIKNGMTQ